MAEQLRLLRLCGGLRSGERTDMSTEAQHTETNAIIKPIAVDRIEISSIAANADIFPTRLTPTRETGIFRFQVAFAQAGRPRVSVHTSTNSFTFGVLTESATLVADEGYSFDLQVRSDRTYNLQFTAAGTLVLAQVDEVA